MRQKKSLVRVQTSKEKRLSTCNPLISVLPASRYSIFPLFVSVADSKEQFTRA